jgi:phage repressor protein C with HTH and peptisase S24 domain
MVAQRIKQFIEKKGISVYAFENAIEASRGSISKAINNNKSIGSHVLEKILSVYEINPIWFMTGEGEMESNKHDQNEASHTPSTVFSLRTDQKIEHQVIPLYDLEASAGLVALFEKSNTHQPTDYISLPNLPPCDGFIHIGGDSMAPILKSGDLVAYKITQDIKNDIFWGEMYLLSIDLSGDEFVTVKWVQKSDEGIDFVKLVSQNESHQAKDIHRSKIRAMGLIKCTISMNTSW